MRTRNALPVFIASLIAGFALLPAAAQAQSQSDRSGATRAECSLSVPAFFSPGLGLSPTSGTFDSRGETGTINCVGTISGQTVTGPGSFGFEGSFSESSCLSHKGSGTAYFTVPTHDGPLHVSGGAFTITGTGIFGQVHAVHSEHGFEARGTYVLLPGKGNCVTEPVTEAGVLMHDSLGDTAEAEATLSIKCDLDAVIVQVNCRSSS